MRRFDLTPLYRATVGFDHMNQLFENIASQDEATPSYPPYNIEKTGEEAYRITMAVAGISESDLTITVEAGSLTVSGNPEKADQETEYLHRGIAGRSFDRKFELADHIRVTSAELDKGLLHISLAREIPEALKPRTVSIGTTDNRKAA